MNYLTRKFKFQSASNEQRELRVGIHFGPPAVDGLLGTHRVWPDRHSALRAGPAQPRHTLQIRKAQNEK